MAKPQTALTPGALETLSPEAARAMIHELQVYQIELDLQNEELRRSQVELDAERARYFHLYDLAPIGYCTLSEQGRILQANLTAAILLGLTRGEMVKLPFFRFIFPNDLPVFHKRREQLLETGEAQAWDLRLLRPDGSSFGAHLEATSVQHEDGQPVIRLMLSDVSARKEAEAALIQESALHKAIFNSANFLSIATDAKGLIQIFNVGAERMLGYSATEVLHKLTPDDLARPLEGSASVEGADPQPETPVKSGFETLMFNASHGIEDVYELTYTCRDGHRLPVLVTVSALRDAQQVVFGYLLIGTDNTARREAEAAREILNRALEEKNHDLDEARILAEKANLAKSEFLSSMSHELRTPLNSILGFGQLIDAGPPPPSPDQKIFINHILQAGNYLLGLINEILDLAKIESGHLSLSMEPVSLPEVLLDCQNLSQALATKHGITVNYPQFSSPCFVFGDRMRLKQTLANLLSNAIKYNRAGGTVEVYCFAPTPTRLRICVQDTGQGLPPEQLTQLFQPFNRLEQNDGAIEGTGIGLVVCKRLVELMGGIIGVESTVGEGSVFWIEVTMTLAPTLDVPTAMFDTPAAGLDPSAVPTSTLLCVEDNPANLMLVEQIIGRRPDIRMISASNGLSGVEMARAVRPDIILMDINLPGLNGFEALRRLAEDPATADIPVVAVSANAVPKDVAKGLAAGFFRYITKPIKVTEFLETVDLALAFAKTKSPGTKQVDPLYLGPNVRPSDPP